MSAVAPRVGPFVDPRMMLPVLDFLGARGVYSEASVAAARQQAEQRAAQGPNKAAAAAAAEPALAVLRDAGAVADLSARGLLTPEGLADERGVAGEALAAVLALSKAEYAAGRFGEAREAARLALPALQGAGEAALLSRALWGVLACDVALGEWAAAAATLGEQRAALDAAAPDVLPPLEALQARTWVANWALFVYAGQGAAEGGLAALSDLLLEPKTLDAVLSSCPWLLRYVVASTVVARRRRADELVRLLQLDPEAHVDALTEFVLLLHDEFDFEGAQAKLADVRALLEADFFLAPHADAVVEAARRFIFETQCRIRGSVALDDVAEQFGLASADAAERWVVELVRGAELDAVMDTEARRVVMRSRNVTVTEQIYVKTRELTARSQAVAAGLGRLLSER